MKFLIIDENEAMVEQLSSHLQQLSSDISFSKTGLEAIDMVRQTRYDLVIMDLMMQDIRGWDICRQIKECSDIPILILSALDNPGMIAEALDSGADDYLIKPVTQKMLEAHIMKLIRRKRMSALQPALQYQD